MSRPFKTKPLPPGVYECTLKSIRCTKKQIVYRFKVDGGMAILVHKEPLPRDIEKSLID